VHPSRTLADLTSFCHDQEVSRLRIPTAVEVILSAASGSLGDRKVLRDGFAAAQDDIGLSYVGSFFRMKS